MGDTRLTCGHEDCLSDDLWADGLCWPHFRHSRAGTKPVKARPYRINSYRPAKCKVEGCPSTTVHAYGWCHTHYQHWSDFGEPGPAELVYVPPPPPRQLRELAAMSARPACTLESAHLFDPSDDEHPEGKQERAARLWAAAQVCDVCPVKSVCLDMIDAVALAAPTTPDGAGVWAGHLVTSSRYRAHPAVKVEDPNRVTCFKCHETKPREEFGKGVREWTSTEYLCKKCGAAKQAEWAARKRAEKQARRVA